MFELLGLPYTTVIEGVELPPLPLPPHETARVARVITTIVFAEVVIVETSTRPDAER